jgi:hypothetical protein
MRVCASAHARLEFELGAPCVGWLQAGRVTSPVEVIRLESYT